MHKKIISTIVLSVLCASNVEASMRAQLKEQARQKAATAVAEAEAAKAEAERTSGLTVADFDEGAAVAARGRARSAHRRTEELAGALPGAVSPAVVGRARAASRSASAHRARAAASSEAVRHLDGATIAAGSIPAARSYNDALAHFNIAFDSRNKIVASRGTSAVADDAFNRANVEYRRAIENLATAARSAATDYHTALAGAADLIGKILLRDRIWDMRDHLSILEANITALGAGVSGVVMAAIGEVDRQLGDANGEVVGLAGAHPAGTPLPPGAAERPFPAP